MTQIVPSPFTLVEHDYVSELIAGGFLGDLRELVVIGATDSFYDNTQPLHWRQDRALSGFNILSMGIWYEAMIRWVGPAAKVMAMTRVNVPRRQDSDGNWQAITIPDHVDILCDLANGAQANITVSSITGLSSGNHVWLYGSQGTIHLDSQFNVFGWQLSFAFGRALQQSALQAWRGKPENVSAAQAAYLHRTRMNGLARRGAYQRGLEKELAA